jgi:hypothetical protein
MPAIYQVVQKNKNTDRVCIFSEGYFVPAQMCVNSAADTFRRVFCLTNLGNAPAVLQHRFTDVVQYTLYHTPLMYFKTIFHKLNMFRENFTHFFGIQKTPPLQHPAKAKFSQNGTIIFCKAAAISLA